MHHEIEFWVLVNESGVFAVKQDRDECYQELEESGELNEPTRLIRVKLKVPTPKGTVVAAELPELKENVTVSIS
jgi:hypothetical protein